MEQASGPIELLRQLGEPVAAQHGAEGFGFSDHHEAVLRDADGLGLLAALHPNRLPPDLLRSPLRPLGRRVLSRNCDGLLAPQDRDVLRDLSASDEAAAEDHPIDLLGFQAEEGQLLAALFQQVLTVSGQLVPDLAPADRGDVHPAEDLAVVGQVAQDGLLSAAALLRRFPLRGHGPIRKRANSHHGS